MKWIAIVRWIASAGPAKAEGVGVAQHERRAVFAGGGKASIVRWLHSYFDEAQHERRAFIIPAALLLVALASCTNPFAPKLEPGLSNLSSTLGDQRTVAGVFRNVQYAFTYGDTLIYGSLLHPDFQFRYYNPNRAAEVAFNRDEEMRIAWNLFHSADQIDIQWNDYISQDGDSIRLTVTRAYTMKIILQASETFRVDGRAQFRLTRNAPTDVWLIRTWFDESNS